MLYFLKPKLVSVGIVEHLVQTTATELQHSAEKMDFVSKVFNSVECPQVYLQGHECAQI